MSEFCETIGMLLLSRCIFSYLEVESGPFGDIIFMTMIVTNQETENCSSLLKLFLYSHTPEIVSDC